MLTKTATILYYEKSLLKDPRVPHKSNDEGGRARLRPATMMVKRLNQRLDALAKGFFFVPADDARCSDHV